MKRAITLFAIFGLAVAAFADPQIGQAARDSVAKDDSSGNTTFSSEVGTVTASLKAKFDAGKTTQADLAENIKAITDLIVTNQKDGDRDQLSRLYLLDAHIYADGLKDTAKARAIWNQVVGAFPGTEAAQGAKLSLARLDAELAMQITELHGPLPLLLLPALRTGTQVHSNIVIKGLTATNIFFAHSGGTASAKPKQLDPTLQWQLAAITRQCSTRRVTTGNEPAEIYVPQLYARSFLNQPAPEFVVEKWITPAPNTIGKFVLIEFWATWCEPCKADIWRLNDLAARYKDKLVVIGISAESEAEVRNYYDRNPPTVIGKHVLTWAPIEYSVAVDTQKRMKDAVGVTGIPHSVLIDPRGIVRFEGMPHWLHLNGAGLNRLFAKYSQ